MCPVLSLELMILLIIILSPLLQVSVMLQVEFTHILLHCIFHIIIFDHCPLKAQNHKTMEVKVHMVKKTFNTDVSTQAEPLKNH